MKSYYIWLGVFTESDFMDYWDNEPYECAMKLWQSGKGAKPEEAQKCGFCREMGLEELETKDYWFSIHSSLCTARDFAKDYVPVDLDAFEKACVNKGIQKANVIWAVSEEEFPGLEPAICKSMTYIGKIEFQ